LEREVLMSAKIALKSSLMLVPLPVVLVASAHEEFGENVMTAAWCGVDCSEPPIIHVSIRPSRHSHRIIKESGSFTVNIPTTELLRAVDLCGTVSGKDGDKFAQAGLTPGLSSVVAAPIVAECPVNMECEVTKIIPLGVHDTFLGEIVAKHVDDSCVEKGDVDFSKVPLIAYVDGTYWSLGKRIGRYGCSREGI
jgi:flavin reductase (DIM6/NTAB) family NADH-FMN oxidoreductase RutF